MFRAFHGIFSTNFMFFCVYFTSISLNHMYFYKPIKSEVKKPVELFLQMANQPYLHHLLLPLLSLLNLNASIVLH